MVTTVYRWLTSGYRGLQQVTAGYRMVTTGYSRLPSSYSGLQQVTEWLKWVTGYRLGFSRLQQVTESY